MCVGKVEEVPGPASCCFSKIQSTWSWERFEEPVEFVLTQEGSLREWVWEESGSPVTCRKEGTERSL